jgi:hypothetical protein
MHVKSVGLLLPALAAALMLAACGSSGPSTPPATHSASSAAPSTSPPAASAAAQIKTDWVAFFNAHTPVARRVSLLQDGPAFASVIKAQAGSSLASSATAKVTKVTVTGPTQATVIYTILVGGQPALKNQRGVAVLQDGTWKVGVSSFCGLLALENGGKTTSLPAACHG